MIPNFVPMAAVYHRPAATGSRDGKLFSRPVVAWDTDGTPLVFIAGPGLDFAGVPPQGEEYIGMWQRGWLPSYGQMSTLLPEHIPGSPDPLAIGVTIYQNASTALGHGGWDAWRTDDDSFVANAATLDGLQEKLRVMGGFTVDKILRVGEY